MNTPVHQSKIARLRAQCDNAIAERDQLYDEVVRIRSERDQLRAAIAQRDAALALAYQALGSCRERETRGAMGCRLEEKVYDEYAVEEALAAIKPLVGKTPPATKGHP